MASYMGAWAPCDRSACSINRDADYEMLVSYLLSRIELYIDFRHSIEGLTLSLLQVYRCICNMYDSLFFGEIIRGVTTRVL